jgi:hypothetical protein
MFHTRCREILWNSWFFRYLDGPLGSDLEKSNDLPLLFPRLQMLLYLRGEGFLFSIRWRGFRMVPSISFRHLFLACLASLLLVLCAGLLLPVPSLAAPSLDSLLSIEPLKKKTFLCWSRNNKEWSNEEYVDSSKAPIRRPSLLREEEVRGRAKALSRDPRSTILGANTNTSTDGNANSDIHSFLQHLGNTHPNPDDSDNESSFSGKSECWILYSRLFSLSECHNAGRSQSHSSRG